MKLISGAPVQETFISLRSFINLRVSSLYRSTSCAPIWFSVSWLILETSRTDVKLSEIFELEKIMCQSMSFCAVVEKYPMAPPMTEPMMALARAEIPPAIAPAFQPIIAPDIAPPSAPAVLSPDCWP